MAEGETYNIPEARLDWFREKITKLGKKSLRLVGEKVYCTVVGYHFLDGEGSARLQKMKIFEVFVAHPDVKLNGWDFVARIDHSQEAGNVVRIVPGRGLPERYRTTGPVCEHCNERRPRRDTFVLTKTDTGEFKQVGSSCLKDFTGHIDAQKWAQLAEILAIIGDYAKGHGFERSGGLNDYRWVNAQYFMALVAESLQRHSWVSAGTAKEKGWISTRERACSLMSDGASPGALACDIAEKAIEWASQFGDDGRELSDWQHNCRIVAQSDALETRHLGIAASIAGVYWSKFHQRTASKKVSDYLGKEGERISVMVTLKGVFPGPNSIRHIFEDRNGNVILWFGSNSLPHNDVGKEITIAMRVKKHQIYNNVKQTLVSHVAKVS